MIPFLSYKEVNAPYEAEIRQAIDRVVESGWYLQGAATRRFEEQYAEYIGSRYAIGCGNGLDALTLIFRAYIELGLLREGDEVIVPANTYIASILSVSRCRLKPVLVEPDIETLQIDGTTAERAITPHTRAILIVHLYGRSAYTEQIGELCRKHHLLLIEDNAQAHGCMWHGRKTGTLGHAAAHSFYPGKNLGALGDAGAVTTDNETLADCVRALGNYGSSRKYVFDWQGVNSRMDEIQAAVLSVKLRYLDETNARRKTIGHFYETHIDHPKIHIPRTQADNVYHLFPILCEERDVLQEYLLAHGVGTMIHYPIPPHRQKCYSAWNQLSFPVTEQIHRQELSLPLHPALTDEEVEEVVRVVNSYPRE
uniref:DegT/DnrJ/EryC1/StrS family aminotransferase n=1 Tax=Prevotella sp. GTC17262 TaxID=3236797 RepID=A0AB33JSD1_9BACT